MPRFIRPDFSDYVVHFTRDETPKTATSLLAKDRLFKILKDCQLNASPMPWTNKNAVCFTECTWASLLDHASRYSRYGVGFSKTFLFRHGGSPAIYLPPGLMEHQKNHIGSGTEPFDPVVFAFVTPFCPPYATTTYKKRFWNGKKPVDYSHEREWRVPHDLDFSPNNVAFVIVDTYEDMAKAPRTLKDGIGRSKWLLMDNYETIEQMWPTHRIP
jgi:hypothetical protein